MAKRETPLILVVEDYPDTRTLLSSLLRSKGYMVIEAGDGKEGVRQANRVNPDLILMDLALPELDGVEATRQIRQRQSHSQTPIFAVSAFATSDVQQDADRKSTRLNSSHGYISYAVFCLKKKKKEKSST